MKVIFILFAVAILCPKTTVHADQENIEAVQIVNPTGNHTFQYVKDNKLEAILNREEIKDRYVVVASIVGLIQTGKSSMLNFYLNYLRKTYKVWSPFTNKTHEPEDGIDSNVISGFYAAKNKDGTTKGIWGWPEIFLHDNITAGGISGLKVAIILLDTEGLFHIKNNLSYQTKIFSLSALFSSIQGYSVNKGVQSDTLEYLDVFSSYTVLGSQILNSSTETPFQDFHFIVRDSEYSHDSENETLNQIFSVDNSDQNRDMKERLQSVFKKIRVFQLPHPGVNVIQPTFDGNVSHYTHEFQDKIGDIVSEVLNPQNIVIKEINGNRVKASDLSHFLKDFTEVVENNNTAPRSLVEVIANASNWILQEEYLQLYKNSMFQKLDEVKGTPKPYYNDSDLVSIHLQTKNESIVKFRAHVKHGGDKHAAPFEDLLNSKIEESFENIKSVNNLMRLEAPKIEKASPSLWIWVGAPIFVALFVTAYMVSKNRGYLRKSSGSKNESEQKQEANANVDPQKQDLISAY